jgi:hypothetical protein
MYQIITYLRNNELTFLRAHWTLDILWPKKMMVLQNRLPSISATSLSLGPIDLYGYVIVHHQNIIYKL